MKPMNSCHRAAAIALLMAACASVGAQADRPPEPPTGKTAQKAARKGATKSAQKSASAGDLRAQAVNTTASIEGVIALRADMDEAKVRSLIARAQPGIIVSIPPDASWTLTKTLVIPDGATVIGPHGGANNAATFRKGFDGPLASVGSWVTLQGLSFDGAKAEFDGDGLVDPAKGRGTREQRFIRVEVRNCRGSGFKFLVPHYYSYYQFCSFDRNDGYGIEYGEVRSHHTDNYYDSCHIGWNGKGGVAFHAVEASSIWENCEFFHNGGPAFDHFPINKKSGAGEAITPQPNAGAEDLIIRDSVIRNSAGPAWLQRGGQSQAIVFQDCRIKHNGDPRDCDITKASGKTVQELFGLSSGPVGGIFHVEGGQLCAEIRGGFAYDNGPYMFAAGPNSAADCRLVVSGAAAPGLVGGGVYAPKGFLTVLDATVLKDDAHIHVQSGIGLDPRAGQVVKYGPSDRAPVLSREREAEKDGDSDEAQQPK